MTIGKIGGVVEEVSPKAKLRALTKPANAIAFSKRKKEAIFASGGTCGLPIRLCKLSCLANFFIPLTAC
ncbi:MAG TPA: hypothetical protein IAA52_11320 [Candidatus Pullichristensenella stercorigallinarum]|uniref:Uncharacterized protein n=1 Tax=Candidatus Pullichristensenella stercorigallinarum TaxID=2840909 RepID=A0A9D1CXG9_9FIRM|nr:hypothetical protein [Candidatus Pullichristensenella stercorigallinarum]